MPDDRDDRDVDDLRVDDRREPDRHGRTDGTSLDWRTRVGIDAHIAPRGRESRGELSDSKGLFVDALMSGSLEATVCLRFIDPYGETLFNGLQMPVLLDELRALAARLTDEDSRRHVEQLETLVSEAMEMGPHVFLLFAGD
jgi:hypothetical protein